jgi:hypothetical protein
MALLKPSGGREISKELLDQLGALADRADNYWHASQLKVGENVHRAQLAAGMLNLRNELRTIYSSIAGENPWAL